MDDFALLAGLETEIGIAVDHAGEPDVVADSIALVRGMADHGVLMRWDYSQEDPRQDARGFRVEALRQQDDERGCVEGGAARRHTHAEIKSDLVLRNGARFYNDHAHPEYSTPECSTAEELVCHDLAGERILAEAARRLREAWGVDVRLYKNNTDFAGHSYGCHENYLLPRSLPWEKLVRGMEAFLVTRQIFAGAGKFGIEDESQFLEPGFQITQRADFFSERQGVDTMQRRPIINTRDEPHADPRKFRRFHVILGDANLSPFATRLKVGATALVLEAVVRDPDRSFPSLAHPVEALRSISRDPGFRWEVRLGDGRASTALSVQRAYLHAVRKLCDLTDASKRSIVRDWEEVLADLQRDWRQCGDRLDWVAKHELVRAFQARESIPEDSPWLQSLDLEYHRIDSPDGLFRGLCSSGHMRPGPGAAEVEEAIKTPPGTTRALLRGLCVERFPDAILAAQWDRVVLATDAGPLGLGLDGLWTRKRLEQWANAIRTAESPDGLRALVG